MSSKHDTLCDGDHTNRQACNSALEVAHAEARLPVTVTRDAASGPLVLEAPRSEETATMRGASANAPVESARVDDDETSAEHAARGEMPAPSPWAVRAWEDTAAAVGATTTPAPPPKTLTENDSSDPRPQLLAGRMSLVAGLAGIAAVAIIVLRSRRK